VRIRARTTSNLRATLLRTRQNNDFTLGVEKSIPPILLTSLPSTTALWWKPPCYSLEGAFFGSQLRLESQGVAARGAKAAPKVVQPKLIY